MAKLTEWLKELPHAVLCGSADCEVEDVVYDSRKARPKTVFVCLSGSRVDSHTFIPQVYEAGCRVFVVEKPLSELSSLPGVQDVTESPDAVFLMVGSGRNALALLSAARFGYPARKMTVIGLTGTKGKTSVSYMLKAILEGCGRKVGVIGTNGCEIAGVHYETKNTTPESYEIHEHFARMTEAGCAYAVMECSSQGFKMHRTDGIRFDYGLFLNISPDHIGPMEHADFDEYLSCKARLLEQSRVGILNLDDPHADFLIRSNQDRTDGFRLFGYGIERGGIRKPDLTASSLTYLADASFVGTEFDVSGLIHDSVRLSLPGDFNVSNALAALCVAALLRLPAEPVKRALSSVHVSGRMEIVYRSDRFQVLVDYAHNEVSMESLLRTLRRYQPKRLVVVFGCGGNRSKDRRTGMGEAAAQYADVTVLTADNSRFEKTEDIIADIRTAYLAAGGSVQNLSEIPDRREAIRYAVRTARQGDMIAVIGKGHEDYQEANGVRTHFLDREEILQAVSLFTNP